MDVRQLLGIGASRTAMLKCANMNNNSDFESWEITPLPVKFENDVIQLMAMLQSSAERMPIIQF